MASGAAFSEVKPMSIPVPLWLCLLLLAVWTVVVAPLAMMYGKAHPTVPAKVAEDIKAAAQKIGLGG